MYSEDIPKDYFCELCKPEDHRELLQSLARGEKLWEGRRRAYEDEKANEKKKKGGRKGKKRHSDNKDDTSQATKKAKATASPAPEPKETKAVAGSKRKAAPEERDAKVSRSRGRMAALPSTKLTTTAIAEIAKAIRYPSRAGTRTVSGFSYGFGSVTGTGPGPGSVRAAGRHRRAGSQSCRTTGRLLPKRSLRP